MVRLKDYFLQNASILSQMFQFQYGSIKSPMQVTLFPLENCFNSNMVRLKVSERMDNVFQLQMFQFQYGSIKSSTETFSNAYVSVFQFQYGSIKRLKMI